MMMTDGWWWIWCKAVTYKTIIIIYSKYMCKETKQQNQIPKRTTENCPGFRKRI